MTEKLLIGRELLAELRDAASECLDREDRQRRQMIYNRLVSDSDAILTQSAPEPVQGEATDKAAFQSWLNKTGTAVKPMKVIGYASPGQVEILRSLPRTGGMKVKGFKDDRYSEPVVTLKEARLAVMKAVISCEKAGAFKTCIECGYQDGHDEICQYHESNRITAAAKPDAELVELLRDAREGLDLIGIRDVDYGEVYEIKARIDAKLASLLP